MNKETRQKLLEELKSFHSKITVQEIEELVEECDFFFPEKVKNRFEQAINFHSSLLNYKIKRISNNFHSSLLNYRIKRISK